MIIVQHHVFMKCVAAANICRSSNFVKGVCRRNTHGSVDDLILARLRIRGWSKWKTWFLPSSCPKLIVVFTTKWTRKSAPASMPVYGFRGASTLGMYVLAISSAGNSCHAVMRADATNNRKAAATGRYNRAVELASSAPASSRCVDCGHIDNKRAELQQAWRVSPQNELMANMAMTHYRRSDFTGLRLCWRPKFAVMSWALSVYYPKDLFAYVYRQKHCWNWYLHHWH